MRVSLAKVSLKSTDDGKTWTLKNQGIEANTCAFELTLSDNGNLFLTGERDTDAQGWKEGT
jgi:hypothetical protein